MAHLDLHKRNQNQLGIGLARTVKDVVNARGQFRSSCSLRLGHTDQCRDEFEAIPGRRLNASGEGLDRRRRGGGVFDRHDLVYGRQSRQIERFAG